MFQPLTPAAIAATCLAILAFAAVPLVTGDPYLLHLLILSMLFGLLAASWNLAAGYGGLKSFGHQAFFGIGAYASALLAKNLDWSPWLTIWLGALAAAAAGFVVAVPVLRIRSMPHVAIVTLGFEEIVRIVIGNLRAYTRGELGLFGIPAFEGFDLPWIGEVTFNAAEKGPYYYLMLTLFVLGLAGLAALLRSPLGLAIVAIRDAQDAAESLGVNLTRHKVLVFVAGAAVAGLCGAFYAHYVLVLTPSSAVGLDIMVLVLAMTLVGGLGTFAGPVVGAFALTLAGEGLRGVGDYRMLIYGAMIVTVTLLAPRGLGTIRLGRPLLRRSGEPRIPDDQPAATASEAREAGRS